MAQVQSIPRRQFGKTGVEISALGLGGHHLGDVEEQKIAEQIMARAIDGGCDNLLQLLGISSRQIGKLDGKRLKRQAPGGFPMTKVCTHGRDKDLALRMLHESLNRLQ